MAARSTVWRDGTPVPAPYRLVDEAAEIGHDLAVELSVGESVTVEKIVTVYTGRDVATSEPAVDAQRWLSRLGRFAELLTGTGCTGRICGSGFPSNSKTSCRRIAHPATASAASAADRFTQQCRPRCRGAGSRAHGEAYRGHIFWDDLFIFPVLNLRLPTITRSLLVYRYRRLPEARHAAKAAGYAGAMFPWQSGSDGREESQRLHLNPRSGRWNPDSSARAHHIGIAVAYSAWKFYQVTGDLAYLIDYGAEMLAEIARFWVSRASYDQERDRYSIRGVIGPDEFHSGYPDAPYDGIDNNAYTNVMAVWVIMRAFDALKLLPLPNRLDLRERLGLHAEELAHWEGVSRRMFVPFHDGVISQFEGYGELDGTGLGPLPAAIRQHPTPRPHPGGRERRRQPLQGFQAGRRADAALPDVVARSCVSYSTGSATASRPIRSRDGRLLPGPHLARVDAQRCGAYLGTRPGEPRSRDGVLPTGAQIRRLRHPGRHHLRRHSPRGHGRQRRPHAAMLHRDGDPPTASSSPRTGRKHLACWHSRSTTAVCTCTCGSAERA